MLLGTPYFYSDYRFYFPLKEDINLIAGHVLKLITDASSNTLHNK